MSLNAILGSAVSALQTNQQALRTTSANIANVNNPQYVRREVVLESLSVAGRTAGVKVAEVRRMAAEFLNKEILVSRATSGTFATMGQVHDRLQGLFGRPDLEGSLPSLVNKALAYASELTLDPVSIPRRMGYVQQLQAALESMSRLSQQVQAIRSETDASIAIKVDEANSLVSEIYDLNVDITKARALGQEDDALRDHRDSALRRLSDLISIRSYEQPDGSVHVMTEDGFALVTESRVEISYTAAGETGPDIVYQPIEAQRIHPITGQMQGSPFALDEHIAQGELRGLLAMRDNDLPDLLQQIGELAANFADQINSVHANSISVPPAQTLEGRNTGLLASDAHGFTGTTTLAVVDATGALVHRIDLDFDAGTYSVDGGGASGFSGGTIGDIVSDIDNALTGSGSASFTDGALTISANAGLGVGFAEPDTGGSSRGGRTFSHFFGLNDLITGDQPTHFQTGIAGTDAHGFNGGDEIQFVFRGPTGDVAVEFTYAMNGGGTVDDILTELNDATSGLGAYLTFALDASGKITATPAAGYDGYQLDVAGDETERGTTGVSCTELFGIGRRYQIGQARGLEVVPAIAQDPTSLALARLDIDGTTIVGDIVATAADNRGAVALADLMQAPIAFNAAGDLRTMVTTIGDYAALVLGGVSSEAASVDRLAKAATAVKEEVEFRRSTVEGVNLDEELSSMMVYQQAYNAAARLVTISRELYDTLLQII